MKRSKKDVREFKAWAERALRGVSESSVFLQLIPSSIEAIRDEPHMALQLGAALLLDKPVFLLVEEGQEIPAALRRAATGVETFQRGDNDSLKRATMTLLKDVADVRQ